MLLHLFSCLLCQLLCHHLLFLSLLLRLLLLLELDGRWLVSDGRGDDGGRLVLLLARLGVAQHRRQNVVRRRAEQAKTGGEGKIGVAETKEQGHSTQAERRSNRRE